MFVLFVHFQNLNLFFQVCILIFYLIKIILILFLYILNLFLNTSNSIVILQTLCALLLFLRSIWFRRWLSYSFSCGSISWFIILTLTWSWRINPSRSWWTYCRRAYNGGMLSFLFNHFMGFANYFVFLNFILLHIKYRILFRFPKVLFLLIWRAFNILTTLCKATELSHASSMLRIWIWSLNFNINRSIAIATCIHFWSWVKRNKILTLLWWSIFFISGYIIIPYLL